MRGLYQLRSDFFFSPSFYLLPMFSFGLNRKGVFQGIQVCIYTDLYSHNLIIFMLFSFSRISACCVNPDLEMK